MRKFYNTTERKRTVFLLPDVIIEAINIGTVSLSVGDDRLRVLQFVV